MLYNCRPLSGSGGLTGLAINVFLVLGVVSTSRAWPTVLLALCFLNRILGLTT